MPEYVLDLFDRHALFVQCGARVAEIVKPNAAQAGTVEEPQEVAVEVPGFDRGADAGREDQARAAPPLASVSRFGLLAVPVVGDA